MNILGVGIDLVDIPRFAHCLSRGESFTNLVFTCNELALAQERGELLHTLAARFAAKEAVLKAMGLGFHAAGPKEIEVLSSSGGRPRVNLSPRLRQAMGDKGVRDILISISHTEQFAVAHAVAVTFQERV